MHQITRQFSSAVNKFVQDEEGITVIEYGLIAALMASAIVAAVGLLGPQLKVLFQSISDKLVITTT